MPERTDWEERAKGILRAEMARKGTTYAQLIDLLAKKESKTTSGTCAIK